MAIMLLMNHNLQFHTAAAVALRMKDVRPALIPSFLHSAEIKDEDEEKKKADDQSHDKAEDKEKESDHVGYLISVAGPGSSFSAALG